MASILVKFQQDLVGHNTARLPSTELVAFPQTEPVALPQTEAYGRYSVHCPSVAAVPPTSPITPALYRRGRWMGAGAVAAGGSSLTDGDK